MNMNGIVLVIVNDEMVFSTLICIHDHIFCIPMSISCGHMQDLVSI